MRISDQNLRGRPIIGPSGKVIGKISGHLVDTTVWRVESLRVRVQNDVAAELGVRRGLLLDVPIDVLRWVDNSIVLTTSFDGFRRVLTGGER